jgi:predicted dehydrogenase
MKNLIIFGLGSIGKRQLNNFYKYFDKITIVDKKKERLEELTNLKKINQYFLNIDKAIKSEKFDVALICTPPSSHLDIAKKCIKNNINIFIEKPMGINSKGWMRLSKECKRKKIVNYVAYCHRFINYTNKFKKLLTQKVIGDIYSANVNWSSYLPSWHKNESYKDFYMSSKKLGGGSLLDDSHGIDLIRYFFGEAKFIAGCVENLSELEMTSDDSFFGILKMRNKTIIQVKFELYARNTDISFTVSGSKGLLKWDRVNHEIILYKDNQVKKKYKYSLQDLMNMYPEQAKYFMNLVRKKRTNNFNDIKDAYKTQFLIDKFFNSHKKRRFLNV